MEKIIGILHDAEIARLCQGPNPMIHPFSPKSIKESEGIRRISSGVSSFGYDVMISREDLKVFTNLESAVIDPRKIDPRVYTKPRFLYDEDDGAEFILCPPNTGLLGHTPEWFDMPDDTIGICTGKSTYARALVSVIVTPLEPGWKGNLVVEVVNHTNSPVRVYTNMGIAQINFFRGMVRPDVTYSDRDGKYQNQVATQDAKV